MTQSLQYIQSNQMRTQFNSIKKQFYFNFLQSIAKKFKMMPGDEQNQRSNKR